MSLQEQIEALAGDPLLDPFLVALDGLLNDLGPERASELEAWVREGLAALPVPLRPFRGRRTDVRGQLLERLAAELAARRGEPEELLAFQRSGWLAGGSPLPYLEHLMALGRTDEAAALSRLALDLEACPARAPVEALLERTGQPPPGWSEAVFEFARDPSVEAWDRLMQFTPEDVFYQRSRNTLRLLLRLGVDGDVLFHCATRRGILPEAVELAERGLVDPETILQRSQEVSPSNQGTWLALAAQAAVARGDRFAGVRFLREAYQHSSSPEPLEIYALAIREHADEELHLMLDQIGVPRF